MALSRERRAFLVGVMGEHRVQALEEALAAKERRLMEAGIGFKQLGEGGRPFGGAVTWEQLDAYERAEETADVGRVFNAIVGNIMSDSEMTAEAKAAAVRKAVDDMESRLGDVGAKEDGVAVAFKGLRRFERILTKAEPKPEAKPEPKPASDSPTAGLVADVRELGDRNRKIMSALWPKRN